VARTAEQVFMPLTVGGGVRSVDDVRRLLLAGADKVAINSAAVEDPELITRAAERFGAQAIVVAIDARKARAGGETGWEVYVHGGRTAYKNWPIERWAAVLRAAPDIPVYQIGLANEPHVPGARHDYMGTPLDTAIKSGNAELVAWMRANGAKSPRELGRGLRP